MPVSPANLALYPGGSIKSPEWLAIRAFVQARAGGKCEECGVKNYALGGRTKDGRWVPAIPKGERLLSLEWPKPGEWSWCTDGIYAGELRIVRIICTVAHVDQGLTDHSTANLRFWCQQCHNRHDNASRRTNARKTLLAKSGQAELL